MDKHASYKNELDLESRLRRRPFLIPLITIMTALALYASIIWFGYLFSQGHYWTILPAGMFGHAFFIILVHDSAHMSVTRTKADRLLMNAGSGMMLLPFYAEFFRKYHLIHHGSPNTDIDPLWPPEKKFLYEKNRPLYVLFALVPLLFTIYLVLRSDRNSKKMNKRNSLSIKVNYVHIFWATLVSLVVYFVFEPNLWFCIGTVVCMSWFSTLRHWCEHIGYDRDMESNTFWFPFGMGIGNHDTHHQYPHISWLSLQIGLFKRVKTTSVFKALRGVLTDTRFKHFDAADYNK